MNFERCCTSGWNPQEPEGWSQILIIGEILALSVKFQDSLE
jgi:hypothetical protein